MKAASRDDIWIFERVEDFMREKSNHVTSLAGLLGVDLNVQDNSGETVAMMAASRGETETVKKITRLGGDLNVQDKCGQTAVMKAALNGKTKTVTKLTELGGDMNVQDNQW